MTVGNDATHGDTELNADKACEVEAVIATETYRDRQTGRQIDRQKEK